MDIYKILLTLALVGLSTLNVALSQNQPACDQSSCYPATGDLLIGREDYLTASSTCGVIRPERYCIVSHLEDEKKCSYCDSRNPFVQGLYTMSHRVENIVSSFLEDRKQRWWQAKNGEEEVYIQLDLEAEFHFTHLIMRFKTFRPAALFVERSYDFGKTWKIYRYFAYDCQASFPGIPLGPVRNINDVVCDSRYSDVAPSKGGEIIFRVLPPSIEIKNPYSEEVQDLLKLTNIRVNFTKLHTLGDDLLDSRDEIKEKYYYAIKEMVIRGSCSCYGHASRCKPVDNQMPTTNMVYGMCECTHNTYGSNCEKCLPFYNDLPWRPARGKEVNACKMCECNNHASQCHFDPAVYEATNRTSGGVCDNCMHNTMGRHCDTCLPFFYRDPARDITDPYVCLNCDCDPIGSEHNGECESHTDPEHDLVAGRCICKRYVDGRRCDTCMNGYWNMKEDNPEGCQECICSTVGTVGNYGCDKFTGECRCKRYVTGMTCDQCLPEFYGLSDEIDGCKACDCDIGGAYDNLCDQVTGQCKCRPHIVGRRCDQPEQEYFVPLLNYFVYEAETATGTGNTMQTIREMMPDRPMTWTGPGFMRVFEGDTLVFTVDNVPMSMEYDILIRYEPQMPDRWDDIRVTVERPGKVEEGGNCANAIPQDDWKVASLPQGARSYLLHPPSCLEEGVTYTIRLDFNHYRSDRSSPDASILIDSIVLLPNIRAMQLFEANPVVQRMREDYERYQCREQQMGVLPPNMPDLCVDYTFSISAYVHGQAIQCECDPTGSTSSVCEPVGGQCPCKPNIIGRTCDQCAPGTYSFGPSGCLACECSNVGSRDPFCDSATGQCLCMPGVFGRQCNECERGYFGFPSCRPCQCNGRAQTCNDAGVCDDCSGNTGGAYCERCADGYYGDTSPGSPIGCRPCMCPGGAESGYQHADTCRMDIYTQEVACNCYPGYTGLRCENCELNWYGNPMIPGGKCERCLCNNNIDPNMPGSCDAQTGECLKCLYHTEGKDCEFCQPGYYGDATQQNCQTCVCNLLGTDNFAGECDRHTGQCPCLPNVVGQRCDRCEADHWKIASGEGCEPCNCDPEGSYQSQCNEFDGQCQCKPGFGGRNCGECELDHWGDPLVECFPCECDPRGSETFQCDHRTGKCVCTEGIAGHKCDECARGTTGVLPNCVPCGECFDDWDAIIQELRAETDQLVEDGSNIKVGGAPGAFDKEFQEMEEKLEEVKRILGGANITSADLEKMTMQIEKIRTNITDSSGELDDVQEEIKSTTSRIETAHNRIQNYNKRLDELKKAAEDLKHNATQIRELDVVGAYNSTKESQRRSEAAQTKVDGTSVTLAQSETLRQEVEDLLAENTAAFDEQYTENEENIREIDTQLTDLDDSIIDLNQQVCGGGGDLCDPVCGGAGCGGVCGGAQSCDNGAVTKAQNALEFAQEADDILKEKSNQASEMLNKVRNVQTLVNQAKTEAQLAHDQALEAKNESETSLAELEDLLNRISTYLGQPGANPSDIRNVAEEVLGMSISLTPEEIQDLATQINDTIKGLTDIDTILEDTKDNLSTARDLKERADNAKRAAESILDTAQRVLEALEAARVAQEKASEAIVDANAAIADAQSDLEQVKEITDEAKVTSQSTVDQVDDMLKRLDTVKTQFLVNEKKVNNAEAEADEAEAKATQAEKDANELEEKYDTVAVQLDEKYNATVQAKERADALRDKANKLYQDTFEKINKLSSMDEEFTRNEKSLLDLTDKINKLNTEAEGYLQDIIDVARKHQTCGS